MTNAVEQTPATEQVAPPELKLSDLQQALQIIDVAALRGAFRGPELSGVGTVRDRVAAFVDFMTPPTAEGETAEAEVEAEEVKAEAPKAKKTRSKKGE